MSVLTDAAVLAVLADQTIRHPNAREQPGLRYTARVVGVGDRQLDVELSQNGVSARTWIPLPESLRPQPWLVEWEPADDPGAWVRQLADWLDEEVYTGGLGAAYARVPIHDQLRLVVDGYGFRHADEDDHQRLRRLVGPHGWHATTSKRQITKQYAAEWALDQVEQQIRSSSVAELLDSEELEWSLRTPEEGRLVFVEAIAAASPGPRIEFILGAHIGHGAGPVGRRRIARSTGVS